MILKCWIDCWQINEYFGTGVSDRLFAYGRRLYLIKNPTTLMQSLDW